MIQKKFIQALKNELQDTIEFYEKNEFNGMEENNVEDVLIDILSNFSEAMDQAGEKNEMVNKVLSDLGVI